MQPLYRLSEDGSSQDAVGALTNELYQTNLDIGRYHSRILDIDLVHLGLNHVGNSHSQGV